MRGREFIDRVKRKLVSGADSRVTDRDVAKHLGISVVALSNWRNRKNVTVRQMVGLLFRQGVAAIQRAESQAIRPIVEFFKLTPTESRGGARTEIFSVRDEEGRAHPYLQGLRDELESHRGVYIIHDSRGRALYAGKTKKQSLWSEINNAYNRDRSVQQIRRVRHPERRQDFRTSDEKRRQIRLLSRP